MMRAVYAVRAAAFLVLGVFAASSAWAGTVSGLNVFQANTTARASEVNDNFRAVADAVNDNADTINGKQARVRGVCPAGQSIRAIAQDGTVTCEPDDVGGNGDITAVGAGPGLSGGGEEGSVSLSVDTTTIQQRVSGVCPAGQSIRAIEQGGTVTCEADDVGGDGDITGVVGGFGLLGGGLEGDVSLDADTTILQERVSDACPEGSAIREIRVDGSVACEEAVGPVAFLGVSLTADPLTIASGSGNPLGYLADGEAIAFEEGDVFSFAPIYLHHGKTISTLRCVVRDRTDTGYIQITVQRRLIDTLSSVFDNETIASVVTFPADVGPGFIELASDADVNLAEVDNRRYGYFIRVDFLDNPSFIGEATLGLRGCVIHY